MLAKHKVAQERANLTNPVVFRKPRVFTSQFRIRCPRCHKVVKHLRQHLANAHGLVASSERNQALLDSECQGIQEMHGRRPVTSDECRYIPRKFDSTDNQLLHDSCLVDYYVRKSCS
jgi:hypothetical protein